MCVDEDVVARDVGELRRNVSDAAHVGGEVIDLADVSGGLQRVVPEAQIEELEFVGFRRFEFRLFDVDATHPIAFGFQAFDEMMADKTSCPGDQNTSC